MILYFVAEIPNTGERVEYGPFTLETDITYRWRAMRLPDVTDITGVLWRFETVKSTSITQAIRVIIVEEGGTARLQWKLIPCRLNVSMVSVCRWDQ